MSRNASNLLPARRSRPSSDPSDTLRSVASDDAAQRDRISEAYLGRWGSPLTQQRARQRIDWMAAGAQGPQILDIGCSEGILAVLLARAGHQVVGVDIEPEAIAAARALLSAEPVAVRERVELCVGDALIADLGESRFDTVALGEVIEHLEDPAAMLERAAAFLKPGGRVVLTTPFGYFPHPDHRQEFRTTHLVRLLDPRFTVNELTVVDGYFRVIARARSVPVLTERRRRERRVPDPHQLLVATEEAAIASQQQLHGEVADLRGKAGRRKQKIADLRQLLVATEEAAVESQKDLSAQLALRSRRLAITIERARALAEREKKLLEREQALTDKVQRLARQLEHQKRISATTRLRLQQAQIRLKQQQQGLRQQLGLAVEKSLQSPLGALRLPWRIAKAYRRARRRALAAPAVAPPPPAPQVAPLETPPLMVGSRNRSSQMPEPRPHLDLSGAFPPYVFPDRAPRSPLRVATVLDEFSDSCFGYEANLVRLTKEGWRKEIERERPAFLFVESAWRGNRENWRGLVKHADHTLDNPLEALVDYCKSRSIPTVFWNKEDPPNFEFFIDAAAKFDYVFTTDADCIPQYRARLGHQRIAALPFAAQPAIHNPIGKVESDEYEIAFAGTWYGHKHEERGILLPFLLDAATDRKLHIFDRMSNHTRNDFFRYPEKYAPYLRSSLAYPNVLSAYRSFKVFLNVNSVTDSPTMFARRVFEILASETAVVSSASTGIEQMLGDVVSIVHDEAEARAELDKLLSDPHYRQSKVHVGYRKVLKEHTYTERFQSIVRAIGGDPNDLGDTPKVSVIIPPCDDDLLQNALANLRRQRYARIEPVWIVRDGAAAPAERVMHACPGATVVEVGAEVPLATMLDRGVNAAEGELITALDPRDVYGPEFIGDLVLALTYADAEVVGKAAYFSAAPDGASPVLHEPASRFRHVDRVSGAAWLARRAALEQASIEEMLSFENDRPMIACANGLGRIYSADPYNYLRVEAAGVAPAVAASLDGNRPSANGAAGVMI
jgi:SAM-dependent methyltransferase